MLKKYSALLLLSALVTTIASEAGGGHDSADLTSSTLAKTPLVIEGLTNDNDGNLYASARNAGNGVACPVWKVALSNPVPVVVGYLPAPSATTQCSPSGLAFDGQGKLYVSLGSNIYRFTPNGITPPTAEEPPFATGVPGTNGVAFDEEGNLWTTDGGTSQGRVWRISPAGGSCEPAFTGCSEVFRVPPMSNDKLPGGIGRDNRALPLGTVAITPTSRVSSNMLGTQSIVANGLAFNRVGDLFVSDTARGAIWRVRLRRDGTVASDVGCDAAFTANTLCLDNLYVQHPVLDGADGLVIDKAGNILVAANERNAIVLVPSQGRAVEVYRNEASATTGLRNEGNLEFPTSPVLVGKKFCTANLDNDRRDNSPASAGELKAAGSDLGKISCFDQSVSSRGLRLPPQH